MHANAAGFNELTPDFIQTVLLVDILLRLIVSEIRSHISGRVIIYSLYAAPALEICLK